MIPANDILLFVDVVKLKSFSRAADKHHITPAAVSKRISALEAALQVRLLNRSTRKLMLTETGELLFQHSAKLSLELEENLQIILDTHKEPRGHLTIHAPTNFSNLVLAPILPHFFDLYPKITIKLIINDTAMLPELGEYDIAIKGTRLVDSNAIVRKILQVPLIVCISKSYAQKHGIPQTLNDLLQHNCLDYSERNTFYPWSFTKGKEIINLEVTGNFRCTSVLLVKNLTVAGLGVARLPNFMIVKELEAGTLIPCLERYTMESIDIHALHPYANKHVPRKVQVFLDFLCQQLLRST